MKDERKMNSKMTKEQTMNEMYEKLMKEKKTEINERVLKKKKK